MVCSIQISEKDVQNHPTSIKSSTNLTLNPFTVLFEGGKMKLLAVNSNRSLRQSRVSSLIASSSTPTHTLSSLWSEGKEK